MAPATSTESFLFRTATDARASGMVSLASSTAPRISPLPDGGGPAGRCAAWAWMAMEPATSSAIAATKRRFIGGVPEREDECSGAQHELVQAPDCAYGGSPDGV